MKNLFIKTMLLLPILFLASCSDDDDDGGDSMVNTKIYQLNSVANPDISGTAKFIKNNDNSTTVELQLNGTPAGGMHPAHIHYNTAAESGDIAIDLAAVNGDTGFSTQTFSTMKNGSDISFEELLDFDGYINVHLSATELTTLVAQGDIGENELTGTSKVYNLNEKDVTGISGTATFYERVNGDALATLELMNTIEDGMHPAHIHMGSVADAPGDILFTFNSVNGNTGMSNTNVEMLDDDSDFDYEDVLEVDGYINVHRDSSDEGLAIIVAQGNVGENS